MKPLIPQTVYIVQNKWRDLDTAVCRKQAEDEGDTSRWTCVDFVEKKTDQYIFTKQELTLLITESWDACADCIEDIMKHSKAVNFPDLPTYINNLLNQQ